MDAAKITKVAKIAAATVAAGGAAVAALLLDDRYRQIPLIEEREERSRRWSEERARLTAESEAKRIAQANAYNARQAARRRWEEENPEAAERERELEREKNRHMGDAFLGINQRKVEKQYGRPLGEIYQRPYPEGDPRRPS